MHDARLRHAIVIDGHVRKTAVTGRVFDRCHSHWSSCARAHFSAADESAVRCDNAPASKLPLFSSLESSHLSLLTGHKPQRWTIQQYERRNKPVTRCSRLWINFMAWCFKILQMFCLWVKAVSDYLPATPTVSQVNLAYVGGLQH